MKKNEMSLTRRDLLKIGAATGAATAVGTIAGRPSTAAAQSSGAGACSGLQAIEAFPTSPLILQPFKDPMVVPQAMKPTPKSVWSTWPLGAPGPGAGKQSYAATTHQVWPTDLAGEYKMAPDKDPLVYQIKLQCGLHSISSSPVRTLVAYTNPQGKRIPAGTVVPKLPASTIYGFNGTFPGPMINAEYGQPALVRFENHLDENPNNYDRCDFGAPDWTFLTHLHNGHTASESDGQPHHRLEGGYAPHEWVDNLYLNYPAGGDDGEKQGLLWFHDHKENHTGANVYKGMAGLYPVYDGLTGSMLDPGDETRDTNGVFNSGSAIPTAATGKPTKNLKLPGVRTNNADGTFNVKYDMPMAFYDCCLDDGVTPHQDFHNGCGETHPEWWGKTYFRHLPNHGFVGDIFTTNGVAYPVMTVERRTYRFRFLTASISRCYEFQLMTSAGGPKSAVSLGYAGPELQGQYRIQDGKQCMQFVEVATGGGLLPNPILRDSVENWPAMRHEIIVDFSQYQGGKATAKGEVIYLTNIMKMTNGRKPESGMRFGVDPKYKIPMVKFVIGDAPAVPDQSDLRIRPNTFNASMSLRPQPHFPIFGSTEFQLLPKRTFELQRGGFGGEIQWLINGHPFDAAVPLAIVQQGKPEVWTIKNGGGGWTHPMHLHMEEHHIYTRNDKTATGQAGHADDTGKDDVIALDGSEGIVMYRNFRTFKGRYVAHCHNLAHEDHNMMFGWTIA